jgi:hypothetical protein
MARSFAEFKDRKEKRLSEGANLEKMRLGQQSCEIVHLLSDPEIRMALVPLTEGEYRRSLEVAAELPIGGEYNQAHALVRDEVQKEHLLFFAAREVSDLSEKWFDTPADVEDLEAHDVNHLYDVYLEMVYENSPSMMGMTEEDFEALKKALGRIEWSELSGQQWYAAQRFLNSIQPILLTVRSSGKL